mmetsp:Transcript_84767/g.162164  ORF Transcript_84767/g.162164 Transcript_84767/m.162164 type:complete len:514 (-) Transcript_84767:122-1663(-)
MVETDSEAIDYDSDFEEASDEDARGKTMHGEASCKAPAEANGVSEYVPPPSRGAGRRPRPRQEESEVVRSTTAEETSFELGACASGGSFSGRRVVRGRVSVETNDSGTRSGRPGTGDSAGRNSRPMWLQHDENMMAGRHLPRHMSPNRSNGVHAGGDAPSRCRSGDFAGGGPSARGGSGRGRPPTDPSDFDADIRVGTADGDQRKIKRLQQEIQRLTQRLKEAELYSSQDDGVPIFLLDEVEVGCQIAQGGFSSVHHAVWRSTPCALKKIFDPVITAELRAEFENEVRMLRRLRHPNVITLMSVCRQPPALSILTEYVGGGSLFELLHGPPGARPRDAPDCEPAYLLPVVQQSGAALAYLHSMFVVHRDVKSHNVLLTPGRHPVAKLCDFGLARTKSELCTGTMQWAGTASYMAPELFAKKKYTEAVDVFAFGVMLWETVSTEIPHANLEPVDIAHRVQSKDGAGLAVVHGWPKSFKTLLRTTMAVQAEERPTMVATVEQLQQVILDFPPPDS